MEAELVIVVPRGLKLSGRVLSCARSVGWPREGGTFRRGWLSTLSPGTSPVWG